MSEKRPMFDIEDVGSSEFRFTLHDAKSPARLSERLRMAFALIFRPHRLPSFRFRFAGRTVESLVRVANEASSRREVES